MILDQEKITRIKRLLKVRPKGLTISDISHNLKINRNSVAKYLEILLITGQVEMRMYGNAKVYYLSNRVPVSSMLKFANELILVLDSDMRVVEANDNFFSYFPVKKEDLIGTSITSSPVNNVNGFRIDEIARSSLETGEVSREISLTQDTTIKYLTIKVVPSVFDDGSKGITLIFEDITEKKEVEDRLRISEAKYRAIVEDQTELVNRFDKDLNILFVNPAIVQYMGRDEKQLIGQSILESIPASERPGVEEQIRNLTPENPVCVVEHRSFDKDGNSHWLQWTNRALFDDRGNLIHYQGVGRDITGRKESEQALLIKNFALASSLNGIGIADLSGSLTYANKSFLSLFGYREEAEVIGKPIGIFAHSNPNADGDIRGVWAALKEQGRWSGEIQAMTKNGDTFTAILNASVVRDQSGTPLCMMASFFDITDIKKTREELKMKDTAIESSLTAMAIFDRDFNLIYANDAFLSELRIKKSAVHGRPAREIIALFQSITPGFDETITALREKGLWTGEISVTGKDGETSNFIASIRCSFDEAGTIRFTLASLVNITQFRSIETALKSSRQKLSETIEFMPDPTFIIDKNHQVIAWNRALEMLTGVKRDEVLGRSDFRKAFSFFGNQRPILVDILDLSPHELARNYPHVRRFGDSIYVESVVSEMNGGKGAYLWGKASALTDHEGRKIGAIESIRDISAWKRARESLRKMDTSGTNGIPPDEEEQRVGRLSRMRQELELVLDLMEEAVLLTDRAGLILWANERFMELVDGDRQIVLGAPLSTFFPADEGQILTSPPGETTLRITLIPLTGKRVLPVEARTAGIPLGDERVVILQHILS
jgi:PAS domain S-box-containing protein